MLEDARKGACLHQLLSLAIERIKGAERCQTCLSPSRESQLTSLMASSSPPDMSRLRVLACPLLAHPSQAQGLLA